VLILIRTVLCLIPFKAQLCHVTEYNYIVVYCKGWVLWRLSSAAFEARAILRKQNGLRVKRPLQRFDTH
jgi:hypothetical protein